jgi:PBP1b-binding outer membrane lipoprotein LpoB
MKIASGIGILTAALFLAGCSSQGPASNSHAYPTAAPTAPVIKPDLRVTGQVAMVNSEARFVVLSFSVGQTPQPDQHLSVYRNGLKVGEVKVTGPQHDNDTVADIITGDVQVQDEVRED